MPSANESAIEFVNATGNPLVIGGVPNDLGRHWVLVRGAGGILWGDSQNDENLTVK